MKRKRREGKEEKYPIDVFRQVAKFRWFIN